MNLIIIGDGGLAREVYDLAINCSSQEQNIKIKGFLSEKSSNIESLGYPPIIGTVTNYDIEEGDVFFCGIGSVTLRKKCVEIIISKGGKFINLIHPTAVISPSVKLGFGVAIKSFCVISSNVTIGDYSFLQSSVIVGHDVIIGKYCQINSFSFFAGCAMIDDQVLVGAHSKFIQGAKAEELTTIGIGSLIIRKVKKNTTVFGTPAKEIMM
jgi:sugar O-acyltransferase (sialic acid O-acetyltransferase NeuD family)